MKKEFLLCNCCHNMMAKELVKKVTLGDDTYFICINCLREEPIKTGGKDADSDLVNSALG
jgi:hypothetical protein